MATELPNIIDITANAENFPPDADIVDLLFGDSQFFSYLDAEAVSVSGGLLEDLESVGLYLMEVLGLL